MNYRVLLADPPWSFGDQLPGAGRGAAKHYPCMFVSEIARFPLPPLARESWLFLWRVGTHQDEAAFVMRAWGFTYAAEIVWVKMTRHGKHHFGMGRTVRNAHEVLLVGKRGRIQPASHSVPSVFEAPVGPHSRKPVEAYELIERLTGHGPYYELFARTRREGWGAEGNELAKE